MQANPLSPLVALFAVLGIIIIFWVVRNPPHDIGDLAVKQCSLGSCTLEETEQLSAAGIHARLLKEDPAYSKAILEELDADHSDEEQASVLAKMTLHYDQKRKHPMLNAEEVSKFKNLADSSEG